MSDIANRIVFGRIGEKDYDEIKPVIEFNTMNQELKDFCISVAKNALKTTSDSHISYYKKLAKKIKLELEKTEKGQIWNCVVGSDYGAFISFEKANLVYFRINEINFLIFRFGAVEGSR